MVRNRLLGLGFLLCAVLGGGILLFLALGYANVAARVPPSVAQIQDRDARLDANPARAGLSSPFLSTAHVTLTESGFTPQVVTITTGTDVVWHNATAITQTILPGTPYRVFMPLLMRNSGSGLLRTGDSLTDSGTDTPILLHGDYFSVTIPPAGTFTHTFSVEGEYPYFLAGNPAHTGLVVVRGQPFDFVLQGVPYLHAITQGQGISYTVHVTTTAGNPTLVGLAVGGVPSGTTAVIIPSPITPTARAHLILTTALNTPTGTFTLLITGTANDLIHTTTVQLQVTPHPDFSLIVDPAEVSVRQSQATTATVSVISLHGFTEPVVLATEDLPAGVTTAWSHNPADPDSWSLLTFTASLTAPLGVHPLSIVGSGNGYVHSAPFTLSILPHPDFLFSLIPVTQVITQGQVVTFTGQLIGQNDWDDPVQLSATGTPTGVTAVWTPNPVIPDGSSTLSVGAALTTSAGIYPFQAIADGGLVSHSVLLTVTVLPHPDFTVEIEPAEGSVRQSRTITASVSVTGLYGFDQPVSLSVIDLPAAVDATWSSNPVMPGASAVLTFSAAFTAPLGTYPLSIAGAGGGFSHSTAFTLNVLTHPDFLFLVTPTARSIIQGEDGSFAGQITGQNDWEGSVILSIGGLPAGAIAAWTPNPVTPDGSSTLTVSIALSTPVGIYPLLVVADGGLVSHSIVLTLTVTPHPDFSLGVAPTAGSVPQTCFITATVAVTSFHGFGQPVFLSVTGLPSGVGTAWSSNPVAPDTSTVLTFSAAISAPLGTYPLTLIGVGGGFTHSVPFTLSVLLHPDFVLAIVPPSQAITQGLAVTYTLQLTGERGFGEPVSLSVSGLPTGTLTAWEANPLPPPSSTVLTLTTALTTPAGIYPLEISGAGGGYTHTVGTTLTVLLIPPDLVVDGIQFHPAVPVEGREVLITVTLSNPSVTAAGPFRADWYVNPPSPPEVGDSGVVSWTLAGLGPEASAVLTTTHIFTPSGSYSLWAQVDTLNSVAEGNEVNNLAGPVALTALSAVQQVCGTISQNTTWYSGVVYVVTCDVTVQSGVTLTVQPGVEVRFNSHLGLTANGTLIAIGTASQPITFTANTTSPTPGYWKGIIFDSSSADSQVEWAFASYGGYGGSGIVRTTGAAPRISHNRVSFSSNYGVYGSSISSITISGTTFLSNTGASAYLTLSSGTLSASGNTGSGNGTNGIVVNGSLGQDTTLIVNPNFPYVIVSSLSTNPDVTLTVPAGNVIKFSQDTSQITDYGHVLVQGTADNPVYFTSLKDDTVGGDTNNDGAATSPTYGDWRSIASHGGRVSLTYAIFRYGGSPDASYVDYGYVDLKSASTATLDHVTVSGSASHGIYMYASNAGDSSTLTVTSSLIENNRFSGIYVHDATDGNSRINVADSTLRHNGNAGTYAGIQASWIRSTILTGNTFTGNSGSAAYLNISEGTFTASGNTGSGNGTNGIVVNGSLGQDTTLIVNPNFPYVIVSSLSTKPGVTLTVPAGNVIKFSQSTSQITDYGHVLVQGTADDPVYFTSLKDDTVGGDTNNDGAATSPTYGDWRSIASHGGRVSLTYATFRYGGSPDTPYVYGYVDLKSASTATLDHVTVSGSASHGIYMYASNAEDSSTLTVTSSLIEDNQFSGIYAYGTSGGGSQLGVFDSIVCNNGNAGSYAGIYVSGSHNTSVSTSIIYGNTGYGVRNGNTARMVNAQNNYWGSDSGPAPYGSGNGINYTTQCSGGVCTIIPYVEVFPWIGQQAYYGQNVPNTVYAVDPVNTANGNYAYQQTDFSIPARGLHLVFSRAYNSLSPANGPVGYGWRHNWMVNAVEIGTDVRITYGDGRQVHFSWNGSAYAPDAGIFANLDKIGGFFRLTEKDQTVYHFDALGRLAAMEDRNGNTMTLAYDGLGRVSTVTEPAGRTLTFAYTSPVSSTLVSRVTDPAGRTVGFTYNASSELTIVTDTVGYTATYAYDANHRLLRVTDANNHTFVTNEYNSSGRVAKQWNAHNDLTTLAYDEPTHKTIVTDPSGHITTYQYDANLRLTSEKDALNNTTSYTYNAANNPILITDKRGNPTSYAYDSRGNVLVITDTLGYTRTYTYDAQSNMLSATDPRGSTTAYAYDAQGNLITCTDALGNQTSWSYDALGQLLSTTDPRGSTIDYAYDVYGHQTAITDTMGNAITFTYDIVGRKLSETDPPGYATHYAYDDANRLTIITDALGYTTTYTYDAVGNRVASEDTLGRVTHYSYDSKDRLVLITDTLGNPTRYAYDANDNRTTVTDPAGHVITFTYDIVNRLASIHDPLNHATFYQYDANGNRTYVTDTKGQITTYAYDALNHLTQVVNPSLTITYTYDVAGNRLTMTDPTGTARYAYDMLNRPAAITDVTGLALHYTYDAAGNRSTLTYPDGRIVTYTYDLMDRLGAVTDPFDPAQQIAYGYNAAGQLVQIVYPNGITSTNAYDDLGRQTAITYTHATSGTLASFHYTLDATGRRAGALESGGILTYTYDPLDRLTGVTYPDGEQVTYVYDAAGNRLAMTSTVSGAITYTYDAANRLLAAGSVTATWDDNGNMLTKGTIAYTYDPANRLTQVASGGVTIQYTYNGDGQRVLRAQAGNTTRYLLDTNSPLAVAVIEVADGVTTTYLYGDGLLAQYDGDGNPTYLLSDGAGNVRLLVDGNGYIVGRDDYDAFGALRGTSGSANTAYRNTGHSADDTAGLVYMRARWYDPALGRFLTTDPLLPYSLNGQDWNLYAYVRNNPLGLVDLDGRGVLDIVAGWGVLAYGQVTSLSALLRAPQIIEQQIEKPLYKGHYHFEQYSQEEVNAVGGVIQGFRDLHTTAWQAGTGPGTIYGSIFGKPSLSGTWREAMGMFGLERLLDRLYFSPARRGIDRTTQQLYGGGAIESAYPGWGQFYFYFPCGGRGIYLGGGTIGWPGGGK